MTLLLSAIVAVAAQLPGAPSPADSIEAYLDPGARVLVEGARSRSDSANASIEAFRLLSRKRISVGMRTFRRDRLLYKQEEALRVSWRRMGEWRVEVLGSRELVPIALEEPQVGGTEGDFSSVDPESIIGGSGSLFRIPGGDDDDDDDALRHPLAAGSEADYRFASGDTTRIRLADGGTITLFELRVIPRRSQAELLSGSFWLESEALAPVRGTFTLAAPVRFTLKTDDGDDLLAALPLPRTGFELDYLTIDYGLWEGRWWLPRLIALEGKGEVGVFTFPILVEQSFEDYEVYGAGDPWTPLPAVDTMNFHVVVDETDEDASQVRQVQMVVAPRDSQVLLESVYLPDSPYDESARLATESDLEQIYDLVSLTRGLQANFPRPRIDFIPFDARLLRYNRVEGLAIGTSAEAEMAPYSAGASGWIGLAERSPSFLLSASRDRLRGGEELSVYRRIEAFSPDDGPFSLGSSLSAFLFGRDDGDYYRALGTSLSTTGSFELAGSPEVALKIYAERQRPVETNTDASVANWSNGRIFRPNPVADAANQVGFAASVEVRRGLDPLGVRGAFQIEGRAETGTFRFASPSARAYIGFPLPANLLGAIEASGGTIFGEAPLQSLWYVGGSGTVRGVRPEDRLSGTAFWQGRAEVANQRPAVRLVLFTDTGWAGPRDRFELSPALQSVGVGVSILDGLLRADLARMIRGGSGWGLQLYLDAAL